MADEYPGYVDELDRTAVERKLCSRVMVMHWAAGQDDMTRLHDTQLYSGSQYY